MCEQCWQRVVEPTLFFSCGCLLRTRSTGHQYVIWQTYKKEFMLPSTMSHRRCFTTNASRLNTGWTFPVPLMEDILRFMEYHHQSILPKGRSFTANSGTKATVLLKGRSSTTYSGTQAAVLLGMDRWGSFPLLSASHSLVSEQTLKDPRGISMEVRGVDLANWALWTSPKFTTGVKYQFNQDF